MNSITKTARKFLTCTACDSAVLAQFINPKSKLCKVCDARRLERDVYIAPERELLHDSDANVSDLGLDNDTMFDAETGEWFTLDEMGERIVVESTMTSDERSSVSRIARLRDDEAARWLESQEARIAENLQAFAAWTAWYCRLKETTDPVQFLANKTREANYVELRDLKDGYAHASDGQVRALVKLGWDSDDVRKMKLTVAEASRLLQRGPRWLWI